MRHEKNISATHRFSRAGWGKKLKRYLYRYTIRPPADRPYFPSDESLRTKVAKLPGIRFCRSERFADRDVFYVFGRRRSMFAKRGELAEKAMLEEFLRDVGESSLPDRYIRPSVIRAVKRFFSDSGCVNVEWTGKHFVAYRKPQDRRDSRFVDKFGPEAVLFRRLRRACDGELPFFYGTALF